MIKPIDRIVIVGGGVAAQRCATALRQLDFPGAVTILSRERVAPYDRTLLSKDMLTGKREERLPLTPQTAYQDKGIELRLNVAAAALDVAAQQLLCTDGTALPYDRLILCSGGEPLLPRSLSCPGVLVLRELPHIARLRAALRAIDHLVIVGGGFIGGEVASAATDLGIRATLIEAAPTILDRVLGPDVGSRIGAIHSVCGVEVLTGVAVAAITGEPGLQTVRLADGREISAGAVVVGVGMRPNVDWLSDTPLRLDNGIVTDEYCQTNISKVLAAGDCARWHNPRYGQHMRVEHWDTAARHGAAAAANALGHAEPFAPVPFFWSDQHATKLSWAGYAPAWDRVTIEDCEQPHQFVARYWRDDQLHGVFASGDPRPVARARRELLAANNL